MGLPLSSTATELWEISLDPEAIGPAGHRMCDNHNELYLENLLFLLNRHGVVTVEHSEWRIMVYRAGWLRRIRLQNTSVLKLLEILDSIPYFTARVQAETS